MLRTPTCPSCLKNYHFQDHIAVGPGTPLTLTCNHTFCEGCLLKKVSSGNELECPICQEKTAVGVQGGVQELMPNIFLLGILALNRRLSRISLHHNSPVNKLRGIPLGSHTATLEDHAVEEAEEAEELDVTVKCEECLKETATCQCKSCDYCKFCTSCFKQVHKSKTLSKHQPLPLNASQKEIEECTQHNGRPLEFFDKTLGELVCALCLISEKCKGHDVIGVNDMEETESSELKDNVEKAKDQLAVIGYSRKMIQHAMPEVTMDANQIVYDIRAHFIALHTLLQKRELDVLDTALKTYVENSSLNEMFQELTNSYKQLSTVVKEGEKLLKDSKAIKAKQEEVVEKLNSLSEAPSYAVRCSDNEATMSLQMDENCDKIFEDLGNCEIKSSRIFSLKPMSETSPDEVTRAKTEPEEQSALSYINLKDPEPEAKPPAEEYDFILPESKMIHAMRAAYERVYVTDIRSPTDFSIQRCADRERLQNMMLAVNNFCKRSDRNEDLVFSVNKGDLVCGQFTADNQWYRGMVVKEKPLHPPGPAPTWENGLCIEVYYIDYGNREWLPLPRLRRMKPEFLDVPELAVPCSLCDVVPPRRQEQWPKTSVDAFTSLVGDGTMLMNIRYRHDGRLFVDLRRPDDDEPTPDDDRPVSVRDALVFLEVGCFKSNYSVPPKEITKPTRVYKNMKTPDPKEMLDVVVTFVNNPDSIFVQKLDNNTRYIHKDLKKLYCVKSKETWRIPYPYRNLVCAARYSEDKQWYRALIECVNENNTVTVLYVDFGNVETVRFAEIRKLPDTWLSVPKQALEVRLKDVAMLDGETQWSEKVIKYLNKEILNKPMVMITEGGESEDIPSVVLCDTSTERDVYIAPLLVREGLVKSTGPRSDPEVVEKSLNQAQEAAPPPPVDTEEAEMADTSMTTYTPVDISPGKEVDLVGVFVDDEAYIYAHKVSDSTLLTSIMEDLNSDNGKKSEDLPAVGSSAELVVGQPCIAKYLEDELWYRAVIREVADQDLVKVEFVDFGNQDAVNVADVRILVPYIDIPRQAVKLSLHNIAPITADGAWPSNVLTFLHETTANQPLSAKCQGTRNKAGAIPASVTLRDGKDLSKLLMDHGLANAVETSNRNTSAEVLTYGKPVLPKVGVEFDVMVTQVDKENMIYLQRLPPTDEQEKYSIGEDETLEEAELQIKQLNTISIMINSPGYFKDNDIMDEKQIVTGMSCCVKDKGDESWYRGRVKRIRKSGATTSVEVLFVDYGLSDLAPIENIRAIPPEIVDLPCQGIHCRLSGVQLLSTNSADEKRALVIEAMKDLFKIVANKRLVAVILEPGPISSVLLYDRINTAAEETGETEDVLVGKLLADCGHVTFDPPAAEVPSDENGTARNSTEFTAKEVVD